MQEKELFKRILTFFSLFCIIGCSYQPIFLNSDNKYKVNIIEKRNSIEIFPATEDVSTTGLLFYPGGLVDSHVYVEILSQISENTGMKCVIAKMPANLAVFGINSGINLCESYADIEQWIIAGHSLGGAMAASTVKKHPDFYKGLIFMDSYPPDGDSLKDWDGVVLSLFSSIEKISDSERMEKTLSLIPPATWLTAEESDYPTEKTNYSVLHCILGGCHSFFGSYGPQDGDYDPTITRQEFHHEVVEYITVFLNHNNWAD